MNVTEVLASDDNKVAFSDSQKDLADDITKTADEDFDDFNDFSSFNGNECPAITKCDEKDPEVVIVTDHINETQNEGTDDICETADEDFDDFADFSSFNPNEFDTSNASVTVSNESSNPPVSLTAISSTEKQFSASSLISSTFPDAVTNCDENCPEVVIVKDLFANASDNCISLWKMAQNLEETPTLKFRWADSHSFQMLLSSLNIDPRNILRNLGVPIFATGLGLLEPIKSEQIKKAASDEKKDDESKEGESSSNKIPPVQFDWNSSGLVNPLDANQKPSNLDLDYFITSDDISNSKTNGAVGISSIEKEFFSTESAVQSESNTNKSATSQPSSIVQRLLSNFKSTTSPLHHAHRSPNLSSEAAQILDELPNLSFMRAKVLMFPIKN